MPFGLSSATGTIDFQFLQISAFSNDHQGVTGVDGVGSRGIELHFPIILFNGHHDDSVVCPHLAFSQTWPSAREPAQKGIFAYPDLLQTQMHVLAVGGEFQKLHDCRPNGCLQHPSAG